MDRLHGRFCLDNSMYFVVQSEVKERHMPRPLRLRLVPVVAVGEWLALLPAAVFLAAAALRLLQPRQYEPARTGWIIFEWAIAHISRTGAGLLFLGLPSLAAILGCVTAVINWRGTSGLGKDGAMALEIFRRNRAAVFLITATLLAFAVLLFTVAHLITD
jgi:hypothetical protein